MRTPYAEVIGDPIGHSKSPLIHGFWLAKLRIDGEYRRAHVRAEELAAFFKERRGDPCWRGCNVTVPHKRAVTHLVDSLDPLAARIGAANTLIASPDGLAGHNSDVAGFLEPLTPWLARPHARRSALIIGTGGAACAIAHALASKAFALKIVGRDLAKANALRATADPNGDIMPLEELARPAPSPASSTDGVLDLVVNATSLGMDGQPPLLLDFSHVPPGAIVYDAVYSPLETPLLAEARRRGLETIDGLRMLVGQAAIAFELFFGRRAPRQHDAELRARLLE